MPSLYKRSYTFTIGELQCRGFQIEFKIDKSVKKQANTASFAVFNLSRTHRAQVAQYKRGTPVLFSAGYDDDESVLFSGGARRIAVDRNQTDYILKVEARDKGDRLLQARINKSYAPNTPVKNVLRDLVDALGIGVGNLSELDSVGLEGGGPTFLEGTVVSGQAYHEFDRLVHSMGLRWSVQNGVLQLQRRNKPLSSQAILLSKETGLIGAPALDTARIKAGIVKATALLMPGLNPGRKVDLRSELYNGGYEIREVSFDGGFRSNDWYAHLTLRPY